MQRRTFLRNTGFTIAGLALMNKQAAALFFAQPAFKIKMLIFVLFFTFGEESAKVSDAEPANQRLFYCPLFQSGLANILSKLSSLSTVYAVINRAIYGLKIAIMTT